MRSHHGAICLTVLSSDPDLQLSHPVSCHIEKPLTVELLHHIKNHSILPFLPPHLYWRAFTQLLLSLVLPAVSPCLNFCNSFPVSIFWGPCLNFKLDQERSTDFLDRFQPSFFFHLRLTVQHEITWQLFCLEEHRHGLVNSNTYVCLPNWRLFPMSICCRHVVSFSFLLPPAAATSRWVNKERFFSSCKNFLWRPASCKTVVCKQPWAYTQVFQA